MDAIWFESTKYWLFFRNWMPCSLSYWVKISAPGTWPGTDQFYGQGKCLHVDTPSWAKISWKLWWLLHKDSGHTWVRTSQKYSPRVMATISSNPERFLKIIGKKPSTLFLLVLPNMFMYRGSGYFFWHIPINLSVIHVMYLKLRSRWVFSSIFLSMC